MSYSIIGIENIDDEVKKEKQHLRALNTEKELARRDDREMYEDKQRLKNEENALDNPDQEY